MTNRDKKLRELELLREKRRRKAKDDFWIFCLWMDYEFFMSRISFIKKIAIALQMVFEGDIQKLAVSLPPRAGKSYITSLFVAWWFGKRPECSIMRNTHTARLAEKFSKDIKKIMKTQRYRDVFPDYEEITWEVDKADEWELSTSRVGVSYFCAGVGGNITGYGVTSDGVAIIDDSVKNFEEASSDLQLEKKWEWYTGVHMQRIEGGAPEIHIGTRWSSYDIMGKTEAADGYDEVIRIPALDENGESFCDAVKTTAQYQEMKRTLDEHVWEAELMQNPVELKGLLFRKDELNRFRLEELQGKKPDGIFAVVDTADEGSDKLAALVGYKYGRKMYIVDVVYNGDPIELTQPLVANLIDRWHVDRAKFESNNGGKGFALKVKELKRGRTNIEWEQTTQNKHTKIIMASPNIKNDFYFLESDEYEVGSEYWHYIEDLCKYKKDGKNAHDDAPDATSIMENFAYSEEWGWRE